MADQKQKIDVLVGEPVVEPSRFSSGVGRTIRIRNTVSISPQYGTLKGLISELNAIQRKYGDRYEDMHFDESRDCGCYYDCQCSPTLLLKGKRYETDIEQQLRLDEAAKRAEDQRVRDEKDLEAIAKRLGKKVV